MSYEQPTQEELVREALLTLICDLSQDCYFASWLRDIEFRLWAAMVNQTTDSGSGMQENDLIRLRSLHELAGGWWVWLNDEESQRFVSTEEWLTIYAQHAARPEA